MVFLKVTFYRLRKTFGLCCHSLLVYLLVQLELLEKHASLVWYAILALIIVSPITIYKDAYQKRILPNPDILNSIQNHLVLNIILSIVFAIIGFVLLYYFYNYQRKKELEKLEKKKISNIFLGVAFSPVNFLLRGIGPTLSLFYRLFGNDREINYKATR